MTSKRCPRCGSLLVIVDSTFLVCLVCWGLESAKEDKPMSCAWLTYDEAAAYLKVHKSTIRRYVKQKKLKVHRPGGKLVRICFEELAKLGEEANNDSS